MDKKNSKIWEKYYKKLKNKKFWPWTELITLCKKFIKPKKNIKVLEIGVGNGANIPFFNDKKFDYYAVDGSQTIIKALKVKYPNLKKKIKSCDFTKEIPFQEEFDLTR